MVEIITMILISSVGKVAGCIVCGFGLAAGFDLFKSIKNKIYTRNLEVVENG
jgi:hypothetical protein